MKKIQVHDFSLKHTAECGQIFRFEFINGWYYIIIKDIILKIRQVGGCLEYESSKPVSKSFIVNYFGIDNDICRMYKAIMKDSHIAAAIKKYRGLRLIRQDPYECMVSYICSSCCNIPRIKKVLHMLSKNFGKEISLGKYKSYSFPDIKDLNNEAKIRKSGAGFRSKYLFKLSKLDFSGFFSRLKLIPYDAAKQELLRLPGIGEKIADCILLFSLGKTEAFPIDVWVKRVMQELYFNNRETPINSIRAFAEEYFGNYAGYAQQYLFHYRRNL